METVLITGTSKGIGFETALAFARAGYKVLATMRNPSAAPALATVALSENLPITISELDVTSDTSVSNGIAKLLADHGAIDVLVNNAGVETMGSVEECPLDVVRTVMETNYMRTRGSGCIIQVSSVAGRFSQPHSCGRD